MSHIVTESDEADAKNTYREEETKWCERVRGAGITESEISDGSLKEFYWVGLYPSSLDATVVKKLKKLADEN